MGSSGGSVVHDFFDGGDLLAIGKAFEELELRFDVFDEAVILGAFQLNEKLFCMTLVDAP